MNKKIKKSRKKIAKQTFKKCPVEGGFCFNPLCAFGCIEKYSKPKTNKTKE